MVYWGSAYFYFAGEWAWDVAGDFVLWFGFGWEVASAVYAVGVFAAGVDIEVF